MWIDWSSCYSLKTSSHSSRGLSGYFQLWFCEANRDGQLKKASHNSVVRLPNRTGRGLLTHRKTGHGRSETLSQLSFDNLLKFSIKLKRMSVPVSDSSSSISRTIWIRGFLCLKKKKTEKNSTVGLWNLLLRAVLRGSEITKLYIYY